MGASARHNSDWRKRRSRTKIEILLARHRIERREKGAALGVDTRRVHRAKVGVGQIPQAVARCMRDERVQPHRFVGHAKVVVEELAVACLRDGPKRLAQRVVAAELDRGPLATTRAMRRAASSRWRVSAMPSVAWCSTSHTVCRIRAPGSAL